MQKVRDKIGTRIESYRAEVLWLFYVEEKSVICKK